MLQYADNACDCDYETDGTEQQAMINSMVPNPTDNHITADSRYYHPQSLSSVKETYIHNVHTWKRKYARTTCTH